MAKAPMNWRHKSIPFELSILTAGIGGDDPSSVWSPLVEGSFTYVEGASVVPFSGFISGTILPVTGHIKNAPLRIFATYSKKAGRPEKTMRDVAVCLAYTWLEFGNPMLKITALRQLVCDAWAGSIPELKPGKRLHGIAKTDHVKRAIKRAHDVAPELKEVVRISKHVHLFGGDDTLAGALIHVIKHESKAVGMIFEPSLKGLEGEPYCHCGFDGWLFHDVSGWEWRFGEEIASPINISVCWRPAVGFFKVDPVFGTNNTGGGSTIAE